VWSASHTAPREGGPMYKIPGRRPGVPSSSCGYSGVTQDANLMSLDDIGR